MVEDRRRVTIRLTRPAVRHHRRSSRCWPSASGCCRSSQHAKFEEMAENNHQRTLALRAPRGVVFDRDGRVLVENRHSYSISIVREHTKDLNRTIRLLADGARRRRGRRPRDRRSAPPRADLPADHDRAGRDAGAGGGGHGAAARLRAARRRRRAGADAAYPEAMAAHLFGYVGEVSDAQVADRRRPEERRHRRPVRASRRSTTRC